MHGFETHQLVTRDGVRLAVHDRPGPSRNAPTILLSNGLGGNLPTWRYLIAYFGHSHRIVSWDYRGLYGSSLTRQQRHGGVDLSIPAHVGDALEVLDDFGIQRCVAVGWSMGVQLNFELAYRAPERVEGIVGMSGGYGRPLRNTIAGPLGEPFMMPFMYAVGCTVHWLRPLILRIARQPSALEIPKRLGLVGQTLDEEVFRDLVQEVVKLDFGVYNRILGHLGRHDVESLLPHVRAPTLVIAGRRDPMTPKWLAQRMTELLPDAELCILPGGTHYVPVELPDTLNRRIADFLRMRLGQSTPA